MSMFKWLIRFDVTNIYAVFSAVYFSEMSESSLSSKLTTK